ncbi:hypothetical protein [Acinetobacter nosocomialis]|uniref:hypothetical protein n=1 Tax=Acinetobacter nosocomialis TaxID=106654 RepID=UPI000707AA69|nr:hypothetical protein [Acinetobacter nosocomialis]KQE29069.1 hypothetical protein APD42_14455 [Acinetobacter nosocomialis]
MAIVDPIAPTRKELEVWCGGNQRILKALEAIFRLIPTELNNLDDSSSGAQITAELAQSAANMANASIADIERLIDLIATSPAPITIIPDQIGLAPRYEAIQSDPVYPVYQGESCPNYNLEVM